MIPVKLQMRNFMCYRDDVPPLYFSGIHTACISGSNGNGKSSLIDAITWALWGKTRARGDDELIHQGQSEVEVELDFSVGEQLYRIIRKHARPRSRRASGQTILEFQVAAGDGFRSISGNTVAETQQRITETIHMDYTTFINSAFLRQGHADEFTVKRPVERKDVLANILGLSVYDRLEDEAKSRVRQGEAERTRLESSLGEMGQELSQMPSLETELAEAEAELARVTAAATEKEALLNSRRQERDALENKRRQLAQLEEYIAHTEKEIAQWEEQAGQRRTRIEEHEELLSRRPAIEAGYQKLTAAREAYEETEQKSKHKSVLDQRRHQLEVAMERAQSALLAEHKLSQSKITELEADHGKLPGLKDELRQLEPKKQKVAEMEDALGEKRKSHQETQAEANRMEAGITALEKEIASLEEKLSMLVAGHDARCPLCETELGADGLKLIEAKYSSERGSKTSSLQPYRDELSRKLTGVKALAAELSQMEGGLNRERAAVLSRSEVLQEQIARAEAAGNRLEEEKTRLAAIEQQLAGQDFAAAEQEALAKLDAELGQLDYDPEKHEEIRQSLTDLQQYESTRTRLEEAEKLINQEREAAAAAQTAIAERRQRRESDAQNRQKLAAELDALPQAAEALTTAEAEYKTAGERQRLSQETAWDLKSRLERLSRLEEKRKDKEKLLTAAAQEEGIYRELAQAFGKTGIQAMLIEAALPEIEAEANTLLARMTDNRMQVKIETQRATKKGDQRETLDINISDELGTRSYEMFSGGEAFRINFAIRIALSRLLARRAGAPLRTLIIDEGFGTQDSQGIEKIKEAINIIQDDFERILVITHIDELRNAFPVRIEVTKTGQGSTIEMS